MHYEIIVRQIDGSKIVNEKLIKEIEIKKPTNIIEKREVLKLWYPRYLSQSPIVK